MNPTMASAKSLYPSSTFPFPPSKQYYEYLKAPPTSSQTILTSCNLFYNLPILHLLRQLSHYLIYLFDSFPPTDNTFPEPFSAWFFTTPAYNLQKVCHTVHPQLQRDNNSVPILCSISNNDTTVFQPYIFATHLTPNIALANHPQQKKLPCSLSVSLSCPVHSTTHM